LNGSREIEQLRRDVQTLETEVARLWACLTGYQEVIGESVVHVRRLQDAFAHPSVESLRQMAARDGNSAALEILGKIEIK